ncbi:efflux transporter outer membrane subunit [Cupriavidus pinatubonensis]|uniref:efflux transporter outer membrane subunit n=1 Tax=Cupriavidus pinatubonensis TaxID=248026 RepID=UPI001C733C57|nr:efflux transporter outer membrane subunit [Cupriavidus pinatubonensis]QYY32794.1 efflux transporter outer membrane subunit [Cupriavidus pinatubonensis]
MAVFAVVALCGCAVGPDFVPPEEPAISQYVRGGDASSTPAGDGRAQHFAAGAMVPADWWRMFGSAELDQAVDGALAANPSLQVAEANLRQADAVARSGAGVFYPQVAAQAQASRQTTTPVRLGSSAPPGIFNVFTLGATISYALDLFGGNRRAVEALAAQAEVQRYAVGAAWLTLTGTLVNTAIARAGYAAQIAATDTLVKIVREQVDVTRAQVSAGMTTHASELSLLSQLGSLEATLPPLAQRMDQADHLGATLAGRFPSEAEPLVLSLDSLVLPSDLPRMLPSELVRHRPDVLAAQAELHVAAAQVGVATAAMLPNIVLSASYGREGVQPGSLLGAGGGVWGIAAAAFAPVFQGGTLYFRRRAAQAQFEAAQANYRQVVLAAFAQVADALRALEHDALTVDAQDRARQAAGELMTEVQANYRAGAAGYLQLLVANAQYQQATIGYIQAHTQRLQDTAALFLALGAGWEAASPAR